MHVNRFCLTLSLQANGWPRILMSALLGSYLSVACGIIRMMRPLSTREEALCVSFSKCGGRPDGAAGTLRWQPPVRDRTVLSIATRKISRRRRMSSAKSTTAHVAGQGQQHAWRTRGQPTQTLPQGLPTVKGPGRTPHRVAQQPVQRRGPECWACGLSCGAAPVRGVSATWSAVGGSRLRQCSCTAAPPQAHRKLQSTEIP